MAELSIIPDLRNLSIIENLLQKYHNFLNYNCVDQVAQ